MKFAIVDRSTYCIECVYESESHQSFGMPWDDDTVFAHIEVPSNLDETAIKANFDNNAGAIVIKQDDELFEFRVKEAFQRLREERNRRLLQSDWTQLPDNRLSIEEQQLWKNYRDLLRDLPSTVVDPHNFEWPKTP